MPTVAEPREPERTERIAQIIKNFVEAKYRDVDDSEDVLSARLFGMGLRGQDLRLEVSDAQRAKLARRKCPGTGEACLRIKIKGNCECWWKDQTVNGGNNG